MKNRLFLALLLFLFHGSSLAGEDTSTTPQLVDGGITENSGPAEIPIDEVRVEAERELQPSRISQSFIVPKDLDDADKEQIKALQQKHPINARADVKW